MRICITGLQGFVGPYLRDILADAGHDVFGIDIRGGGDILSVDITDPAAVRQCIEHEAPDAIAHLAAISHVDHANPHALYTINVTGTLNLLDASIRCQAMPRFLMVSSSQVYGIVDDTRQPIDESAEISPVNHYGASKAASEILATTYRHEHGLPVAIARPFNHIGRGQDPGFVIAKIIKAIREGETRIELGNCSVIRDFLDVRDVAAAYAAMITDFHDGGTYNIASGKGVQIADMLRLIQEIAGVSLSVTESRSLMRSNEITKSAGDSTALRRQFNWKPVHDLRETIAWMLSS